MPNPTIEDYVKTIYMLQRKGEKVTTSALALQLQLADASITDMLKKLSSKGFVRYERYQGVELTGSGRRMALKIVRRHRLWEMFLVEFLGFSWDKIHDEAERLEHVTSDELEHQLDKVLGFPTVDPHGDPIPTINGELDHRKETPLADYDSGAKVRIYRVSDHDPEILQHAARMGLALNTKLVISEKMRFDGSMVVRVGSKQRFLSREVAKSIFVEPV